MRKTTLAKYFVFYTTKVIALPVFIAAMATIIFLIAWQAEVVHPANYEMQLLNESAPMIADAEIITEDMFPDSVEYILVDKSGTHIIDEGNMRESAKQAALDYLKNGTIPSGIDNPGFLVIESRNAICIARYSIIVKFANPVLQKILPYPELTLLIICGFAFIIMLLVLSRRTAGRFQKEVQKLLDSTEKIKEQDLGFISETNAIKEFHLVADSLDQLRDALKISLNEQIILEKNKTEQISALAHDIKIPVTVIKGNAQLLNMSMQNEKEQEITQDILYATDQIEAYTQSLIEISKLSSPIELQKEPVLFGHFLKEIEKEATVFAKTRQCRVIINNSLSSDTQIIIDAPIVSRALMNIVTNGIEHMSGLSSLQIIVRNTQTGSIMIEVQDTGNGFSKEALDKATSIFFTEDKARTGGHHGIGLSFANQVAIAHGGSLVICNNEVGGLVQLVLPM